MRIYEIGCKKYTYGFIRYYKPKPTMWSIQISFEDGPYMTWIRLPDQKCVSAKHRSGKWEDMESFFVELQKDSSFILCRLFLIWWIQSSELCVSFPREDGGINAEWWSGTSNTFQTTSRETARDHFLASRHKCLSASIQFKTSLGFYVSPHGDVPSTFSLLPFSVGLDL